MIATTDKDAYRFADIIVVDVPFEADKPGISRALDMVMSNEPDMHKWLEAASVDRVAQMYGEDGDMSLKVFTLAIEQIAESMKEDALVIIETTVPPGTTDLLAMPILERGRAARGITSSPMVAHSYERVMPGKDYLKSIYDYPRQISGIDERSLLAAKTFFESINGCVS